MYREKLISQIEALEKAQTRCNNVQEFITLSRNILDIAQKIDGLDENAVVNMNLHLDINDQDVYETIRKASEEHRQRHTASPLETTEQTAKETLKDIANQALNES